MATTNIKSKVVLTECRKTLRWLNVHGCLKSNPLRLDVEQIEALARNSMNGIIAVSHHEWFQITKAEREANEDATQKIDAVFHAAVSENDRREKSLIDKLMRLVPANKRKLKWGLANQTHQGANDSFADGLVFNVWVKDGEFMPTTFLLGDLCLFDYVKENWNLMVFRPMSPDAGGS